MQPSSSNSAISGSGESSSHSGHISDTDFQVIAGQAESSQDQAQQASGNVPLEPTNDIRDNQNTLVEFSVIVNMADPESILENMERLERYINLLLSRLASHSTG